MNEIRKKKKKKEKNGIQDSGEKKGRMTN